MPFTRHLYELDEVVSALQVCLRNGWGRALFWTWELLASREYDRVVDILREGWFRWGAPNDPTLAAVFPTLEKTSDSEQWISVTTRVLQACRTAFQQQIIPETFLSLTAHRESRWNMTPIAKTKKITERRQKRSTAFVESLDESEDISAEDAANWWISYDAACRQGYRRDAIWLLQTVQPKLSADAIWSAIRIASRGGEQTATTLQAIRSAISAHPVQQILGQTAATLLLCEKTETRSALIHTPPPPNLWVSTRDWDNWCEHMDRRSARLHPIPVEALHRGTTRGALSQRFTNIDEIREPLPSLIDGCHWWKRQIAKAGIVVEEDTGAVVFESDESLEDFYDRHFPDDTPDEWSRADQEKSHGRGCAETAPAAPLPIALREEHLTLRCWNMGIHVPSRSQSRPKLPAQLGFMNSPTTLERAKPKPTPMLFRTK
jgi:hypothetical protein